MEKLTLRKKSLKQVSSAFERALKLFNNQPSTISLAEREAYVASVIKHFELFFESLWKTLKIYLFDKYGTQVQGSRDVFRACYQHKLISEEDLNKLLKMIDDRNMTTHVYNEEIALQLARTLSTYVFLMNKVTSILLKDN